MILNNCLNKVCFFVSITGFLFLFGCNSYSIRPIYEINSILLESNNNYIEPYLGDKWLATIRSKNGKQIIEIINLKTRRVVFWPGLNRSDSQPISVSINSNGDRLAFIRQRSDQTELLVYRRNLATSQRVEIVPKGVPRRVSLDGFGRTLAVQVSRDGRWDVEIIRLSDF